MNIVEHVFLLPVGPSPGYMPRRGIAGSSSSIMSNFLRNSQTDLEPLYKLAILPTMEECSYFSTSNEMIMWFLSLSLFIYWITLMDFRILNHPCIPEMKPTWSGWMIVLMCSWIRLARTLLRILHQYS